MTLFKTERELKKFLEGVLKEAIDELSKQIKESLYNFIWYNWYMQRPESDFYERTYQFIDSLTIDMTSRSGKIKSNIYFDLNKITPNYTGTGFNSYMSFNGSVSFDSHSIGYHLADWLENGNNGSLGNNPITGIHYLSHVNKFYETGELDKIMKRVFKKYGLTLTSK